MKKIAIILAVLLVLVVGAWVALTKFIIDSDEMAEQLTTALTEATGREVLVSRTAEVSLFPTPQVAFNGIRVNNLDGASTPHFISSPRFIVKLDMADLLGATASPSQIVLEEAEFNLEVLPGGQKNWQFTGERRRSDAFRAYFLETPIRLSKSMLRYVNAATGTRTALGGIEGTIGYDDGGQVMEYTGDVEINGSKSRVMTRMRSVDLTAQDVPDAPFQLVLEHAGSTFKAQGKISNASKEPEFIGEVEMDAPNLWGVIGMFSGVGYEGASTTDGAGVTAKGSMTMSMGGVRLADVMLNAAGAAAIPALKGKLDMEYRYGKSPYLRLQSDFETIDMDYLLSSYEAWSFAEPAPAGEKGGDAAQPGAGDDGEAGNTELSTSLESFLQVASGAVELRVGSLIYHGSSINNIRLDSTLQPRRMTIREGRADMPGKTRMVFSGVVGNREEGLGFDGKFEMQGQEMEQFMSLFAPKDVEVPPLDLGRFGIRTNVALDKEQLRLSEFQARVADTRMAGAVILRQGERPKLESYLRVADINLDTVGKAIAFMLPEDEGIKSSSQGAPGDDIFDVTYLNTRFNWLSAINIDIDSDFLVQDFVLFGRKGGRADFHVELGVNKLVVDKINANYNESRITGAYGVRVEQGRNPFIQIDTTIDELNLEDLFPDLAHAHNDEEWQVYIDEPLELLLLQTHRADIKANIGKLNIRNYTFDNIDTRITLDKSRLTVEKFAGYLWGGSINMRAAVQAGTIPSAALTFALENSNLVQMSQASRLLKYAAGLVGSSGQVSTSGVTLRSWLSNAKGELRVSAADVSVQGFGISTLARAVPVARQVRDIERAREQALRGGITRISRLNGLINIHDGKASTPQMNYTAVESRGSVQGMVDFINETVDLMMSFVLLNTEKDGESPPVISLKVKGDIDEVEKELDTKQLENYVSQSAAERALGRDR